MDETLAATDSTAVTSATARDIHRHTHRHEKTGQARQALSPPTINSPMTEPTAGETKEKRQLFHGHSASTCVSISTLIPCPGLSLFMCEGERRQSFATFALVCGD